MEYGYDMEGMCVQCCIRSEIKSISDVDVIDEMDYFLERATAILLSLSWSRQSGTLFGAYRHVGYLLKSLL